MSIIQSVGSNFYRKPDNNLYLSCVLFHIIPVRYTVNSRTRICLAD